MMTLKILLSTVILLCFVGAVGLIQNPTSIEANPLPDIPFTPPMGPSWARSLFTTGRPTTTAVIGQVKAATATTGSGSAADYIKLH